MKPTVHIALSVHNGVPYLDEQIRSLQAQTHEGWRLWVRDDGSTDETPARLGEMAARDPRIHVHPRDGERLGTTLCHDWLLHRIPREARYVASCDADDVWLPGKLERSLVAMQAAEAQGDGPVLVHTDLAVVDGELNQIAPSFWSYSGTAPEPTDLARLLVANVATGPTLLLNRALLDRVLPIPAAAAYHDWWIALVASAFGRVVGVPEATVLYRRHGANVTSGHTGNLRGAADGVRRLGGARGRTSALRAWVAATGLQAAAFLLRFEDELSADQTELLRDLASVPTRGFLGRKLGALRHHALPERGLLRNLGLVLRV